MIDGSWKFRNLIFEVQHFPGKENVIGDSLSRVVDELEEGNDNDEDETKVHRVSVLLRRAMNNDYCTSFKLSERRYYDSSQAIPLDNQSTQYHCGASWCGENVSKVR